MKKTVLLTSVCALALAASAGQFIQIRNPGFEDIGKDGRICGWSVTGDKFRAAAHAGHSQTGGLVWESTNRAEKASLVR